MENVRQGAVDERAYLTEVVDAVCRLMPASGEGFDMREYLGPPDEVAERLVALMPKVSPWSEVVGPVYTTHQVRMLLGAGSRQAMADRVRRRTLLALRTRDGHVVYPTFQFAGAEVLPGLARILQLLADSVDGWTLASWLRLPQPQLGEMSVVEWLGRNGADDAVLAVAQSAQERWSH